MAPRSSLGFRRACCRVVRPLLKKQGAFVWFFWLCLLSPLAEGALPWRWSNPRPHGNHIYDAAFREGVYVQVGDRGRVYVSEDLDRWRAAESGTRQTLRGIAFLGKRAVIGGASGTIVWSDDLRAFHVVQLPTSAWIEGVAASSNLVVAVGDAGAIFTSSDGVNWTPRNSNTTQWLTSAAYRNGFYAAGENGTLLQSADGMSWQASTPSAFAGKHVFGLNTINNQLWAVGQGGLIASLGLRGWAAFTPPGTNDLYAIAGSTNMVVAAGDGAVFLREGAGAWVSQTSSTVSGRAPIWPFYSVIWDERLFFLGGRSGVMAEGYRTNSAGAVQWFLSAASPRDWLWAVTQQGSLLAAVGNNSRIMTSLDGAFWDAENSGLPAGSYLLGVGGRTNLLVAVGSGGTILTSANATEPVIVTNGAQRVTNHVSVFGIRWTAQNSGTTRDLQGVAASPSQIVVSGADGRILRSSNGSSWSGVSTPSSAFLSSVAHLNGTWVATGDKGTILSSADASQWTARGSGTTNWIYQVRALNGQFIAVGENGVILTSPNGAQWTHQNLGPRRFSNWLNDAAFAGGKYYAVSGRGSVLESADGTSWTDIGSITSHSLYGLAATPGGKLVAVGTDGAILRAQLTPFPRAPRFAGFSQAGGSNAFLFAGEIDQRFTLQSSSDLMNWSDTAQLEISEEDGTLLHLQPQDAASRQFFRAVTTR